jgi:Amt family ammonium transporter
LFGGGFELLGTQFVAVAATIAFSLIVSLGILKFVQATVGLRVTEEEELGGVDLALHAEVGYALAEGGSTVTLAEPHETSSSPAPARVAQRSEA